jgi:hypothetical protein
MPKRDRLAVEVTQSGVDAMVSALLHYDSEADDPRAFALELIDLLRPAPSGRRALVDPPRVRRP